MRWPQILPDWVTPELALSRWRERIDLVSAEETAYLSNLPYVKGVALIGSVGRRDPWPCSDIDLLIIADRWQGQDPERFIRAEETKRNERLQAASIPNVVEAGNWVLLTDDVVEAVDAGEDEFLRKLEHSHWLGVVIKSVGASVAKDFDGQVGRFLDRCNHMFSTDCFIHLWLGRVICTTGYELETAARLMKEGDWSNASLRILRTAYQDLPAGCYAMWQNVPQSSARGVSRFLDTASSVDDQEIGELYLKAARLTERDVWQRFAAVPPSGKRMRDVMWAIRRGAGERIDGLAVTRDVLNLSLYYIEDNNTCPLPRWTGVTNDAATVRAQFEAAKGIQLRLRSEKLKLER